MCNYRYYLVILMFITPLISMQAGLERHNGNAGLSDVFGERRLKGGLSVGEQEAALKGHVFHDADGLKNELVNQTQAGTGINLDGSLTVVLANKSGLAIRSVKVKKDGTYQFQNVAEGTYKVLLTNLDVQSGRLVTPSLPSNWVNVGEQIGAVEGVGIDAEADGQIEVEFDDSIKEVNFGIQQPPVAEQKAYIIPAPFKGQMIRLNGTLPDAVMPPNQLTGCDAEDAKSPGGLNGNSSNRTVIINSLPHTGKLIYDGDQVENNQVICNYDKNRLAFLVEDPASTMVEFSYAFTDAAGSVSRPENYILNWINNTPLPVRLESFSVSAVMKNEIGVQLKWITSAEEGSERFEIERSGNSRDWFVIGQLDAKGESSESSDYTFYDHQPVGGTNYYRLKMLDRDGSFEYSRILTAVAKRQQDAFLYPNPASNVLNVKSSESGIKKATFYDLSGNMIARPVVFSSNQMDVSGFPPGYYLVRIADNQGVIKQYKATINR